MKKDVKIGFIGQGFIGKSYADDFENRGFSVVRYALEEPYINNKDLLKGCDIVFIAVPTPTTVKGFDISIVEGTLSLLSEGTTVIIKSTIIPGTVKKLSEKFPQLYIMHSPEFLRERTAAYDAANPERNIIGIPSDTPEYRERAQQVMDILPKAPYTDICAAEEAELVKYGSNCFLMTKVIFMNIMYDMAQSHGADFDTIAKAMKADSRIGDSHMNPVHASGHVEETAVGRGAGGHCFIKDFAAFANLYEQTTNDTDGLHVLRAIEQKNSQLLRASNKDIPLLEDVYGTES